MTSLDNIKEKIRKLYETNPCIHINVNIKNPRINLSCVNVTIKGIYPNLFRVEEKSGDISKTYTVQYKDVLLNRVEIIELS